MKLLRVFFLLLATLLALPLAAQTPTDPVAWLRAEGNATDATTNGNNGVVSGTVPYVTGKVGNAFNFTGNVANYVRIPNSASLQSSLLTVEYWVNFNSALNAVTVAKRNGSSDAWQTGIVFSGGNFLLQFVGNTSGGLFDWYSAPLSSPVGVWTHVAVTYDGSTVKGYINGSQVLTQAVALQLSSRTADIYVGNYAGTALPLDAKLDELSIYNRALSAAEVLAIYQAGATGKTAPAPTVTSLSPNSGTTAGGTSVTITGTNFTGATSVTFGGNAATNVTVVNATTITATTPAGTAGTASVIVTTPGGSNSANSLYTYVTPAPTVTAVSPTSGSTAGGTSVTLTGTNFTGATGVTFGGSAATNVSVVNATTITATTPAGTAGTASVIVTTPSGSNAANSLYTYATPVPSDPVAWLRAEGNALDATSNGNHGAVTGSVAYTTGRVGSAFSFNGTASNFVRIPNAASLQSSLLTVEYWIYFNSAQNSLNVTKRSASGAGDAWQVGIAYAGGNFLLQFVGSTAGGLFDWYSPALSSPVGAWTHVAATYDGTTVRGYVNGVLQLTQAVTLNLSTRNADIYVGATANGTSALDGKVDELAIYNRALSATEVQAIYQAGAAGKGGTPAPTVTGISPSSGSTVGGTSVTITGTNFSGSSVVTIGGTAATNVTVVNSTTITATTPAGAAGTASVVVNTPGGSNAANSLYTYVTPVTAPSISSVSPATGTTLGGTTVTITGANFTGATSVTFGGTPATNFTVVSATTLTATTPAKSAGAVSVVVTNPSGSNAANSLFTYVTPSTAPSISSVSPASGSTLGGTTVTITGTNFTGATSVTFGGTAAASVSSVSATSITAVTPAGSAGTASVVVTTLQGSNVANSLFTYVAPPTVTGISPASGTTLGGTSVTITGTNFTGATGVTIGGAAATNVTIVNATTITATTAARSAGTASVVVTTPGGGNAANTLYTYVTPAPVVTGVSPSSGTTAGGTSIAITGSNLTGATSVTVGGVAATGVQVFTDNNITAFTPAGTAGTASVIVTTPGGSNAANSLFTYVAPPTGPVAWLNADGHADDITGNGNHGVVNGSVPYVAGKVGSAFSFTGNGANSIRIPNSTSLQSANFSVEYWIYFNSAQNSVNVTKRNGSSDAWQVGIAYAGGNFLLQFLGANLSGMGEWYSAPLSSPVGVWTHVAVTYSNSTIRGYVNGVMVVEQVPVTLIMQTRTSDIYVGASSTGTAPFDGKIDELSLYNRALSQTEIQAIVDAGSTGKTPPAPTVTSLTPASGSTLGGTSVTITGTNLNGATGVTIGGNAATNVSVVNRSTLTATTPAGTAGSASVVVTTPGGSNLANTLFTYVAPPTVASVSPNNGSGSGGTSVTLTGTGFTGATGVTFGGNAATNVTVVNATTITATVPARSAGTASVVVTTIGGSNAANSLFTYSPTVTASTANLASNAPALTINGAGFSTTPGNNTVAFTPAGTGTVTAATATSLTVTNLSGLTTGALSAVVTTNGQSSGTAVQVATVVIASAPPSGANKSINLAAGATYTFTASDWGFSDAGDTPPNNFSAVRLTTLPGTGSLTVDGTAATAGQSVSLMLLGPAGATWTVQSGAPASDWRAITSSADGTKLAAVVGYFGQIYTSADTGVTWTARESTRQWRSITSSADGTRLAAVDQGFSGGKIYTSSNSGATWTARATDQLWQSIASSSDGTKLVAAAFSSQLYTSTDSGVTWTARESVRNWRAVASSADGTKLVAIAAVGSSGQIYTSTDSGATWTARSTYTLLWAITSSADGTKLAAEANGGRIYTSTDSGATWTARESDRAWNSITSSADGTKLAAVELGGQIYLSTDSGATWSARESNRDWRSVTSSADGTKLAAAAGGVDQGVIATSAPSAPAIRYTAPNAGATTSFTFQVQDDAPGNNLDLSPNTITLNVAPPPPTIIGISPVKGVTLGGTAVTLTGTDFTGATSVTFGGAAATNVTVVNSTTITATTPAASSPGAVSVVVTTPSGSNAANSLFTYELPGIVVNPSSANLISSGTRLIITGTGFDGTTPGNNVVTFSPSGTGTVTASTSTSLTVTGLSGLTVGALNAVVTISSANSGAPVQVANVVAPIPGDLIPRDVTITGSYVSAVAVQPDGKTILAGFFSAVNGVPRRSIARLNADGSLDLGFDPNAGGNVVYAVALQPDGKIVIGGGFNTLQPNGAASTISRSGLARLNADGTVDPSFNTQASGTVQAVSVHADGKILLGGSFSSLLVGGTNTPRGRVARLNADGSLDAAFNPNVTDGTVYSILPQANGRILLGGFFNSLQPNGAASPTSRVGIARVNTDGSLDAGFDPRLDSDGQVNCLVEQPDGKILFGGRFGSVQPNGAAGATSRSRIARVNADGTLDPAFAPAVQGLVYSLALQTNGKIFVGGDFSGIQENGTGPITARANLARLNANGSLDAAFDPKADNQIFAVALQSDGTILLGGNFSALQPNGAAVSTPVNRLALLINEPAPQTLSVVDGTTVRWTRGGAAPAVARVAFAVSVDSGSTWISLGAGSRIGTPTDWQLSGLSLPAAGILRARGTDGSSLWESTTPFSGLVAPAPTVTGVSPANGTTFGGTSVTLTGNGFIGVAAVKFGGTDAASFTVVNATTITAVTPARAAGAVSVVVTTPAGSNTANSFFTFITPPAPTVSGVSPSSGVNTGGTSVTITGTEFLGATSVTFGGTAATNFTVVNSTTITATAPAGATGAVSVVVTTPSGSNPANTLYSFVPPPPTLASVSPSSGINRGGTLVTLTGTDFTGATSVKFGTRDAVSFTVVNSTTITAVTPATGEQIVSVVVTTPTGSNAANSLFTFRTPIPTNTQLSSSQFTSVFLSPPTFSVSVSTLSGAPVPGKIALFIDDVLLERKAVDSGGWAYFTPTPAQLRGGTRAIRAVYNDDFSTPDYDSSEAAAISQTVNKSPVSISLNSATLTQTYDGTSRAVTFTTGTLPATHTASGVLVNVTYNGGALVPINAGTYAVVATINDPSLSGTASGTLTVNKAAATCTFQNLVFTWDGQPKPAVVTVTPAVPFSVTYDPLVNNTPSGAPTSTPPTNPGNYKVIVTNPNYAITPPTTNPLTITPRGVSISLGNLIAITDGTPKRATVTTNPAGINVIVRYQLPNDFQRLDPPILPVDSNWLVYVTATVDQTGYAGSATALMQLIPQPPPQVFLNGPTTGIYGPQTYEVSTDSGIAGKSVSGTVTFLNNDEPIGAVQLDNSGRAKFTTILEPNTVLTRYRIKARFEANVQFKTSTSNTIETVISKRQIDLVPASPLTVTYDGTNKSVAFKGPGTPPLSVGYRVTYNGSNFLPNAPTTSPISVTATINDNEPRYFGSTTVPLTINKAPAIIALGSLKQSFDGTPKPVSVATTPAGVATTVTYNGSSSPPSAAGSYSVVATLADPNYSAQSATGTLNITVESVRIAITNTLQVFSEGKSSYPVTVTTTPAVTYRVTYDGRSYDYFEPNQGPYGAGTYDVVVTITQLGYTGTASATLVVKPLVTVNHPETIVYGSNTNNPGFDRQGGASAVDGDFVSPSTPFPLVEGAKLRFFDSAENEVRYRFVRWKDGNPNQERLIEANRRVYTPIVRPEIKILAEAHTNINGVEQKSTVGGTVVPLTNGRTYANEREVVTFVATPNPGYVVDRWEHHDFSSHPQPTIYSLQRFSHLYGTKYEEQLQGFTPVKVYFTKGYTATSGVNVREAGSVELVRQDGYGYDETFHVVGRVDARFPNAVIPEGINTVARAVPNEGFLFNTWILEGALPADLSNPSLWNPEYNAALIRPTLTVKPFPGVTSIKLTAVFVRKVAAPVASFTRNNELSFGVGNANVSVSRSPILKIANEGTAPLVNARITGVEISGARLKVQSNEAEELNTGGFFEFYLPPSFRPLTPDELAAPDPYNIKDTEYGIGMIVNKPRLTAPRTAITESNPITIGTLNPGQDREFNDLQYAWVKTDLSLGDELNGVSFSFLQYRVTIWITADNFPATPVSFWTN